MEYPQISGTTLNSTLAPPVDLRQGLPSTLTSPSPPGVDSKSIFAFWHTGLDSLPPYLLRNVLAWHRHFSPSGWTIYVLDNVPNSPLNVSNYIDTKDPSVVPAAFSNGSLNGGYMAQHTSDLIRYPLLLKYGGIYMDAGILQFGDLNWLWEQHITNPASPYDFAGFTMGAYPDIQIVNFWLMCRAGNPLVRRAHRILLKLWEGKTNTTGMHAHPLVNHVPLLRVPNEVVVEEEGKERMVINDAFMTDYAIQIQAIGAAQRWLDEEDGWDGPKYVREKAWLWNMIEGAYVLETTMGWNGPKEFELMKMRMPAPGEEENSEQALARQIVEKSIAGSWCLKLGHGFSAKLFGADTIGMLWRKHDGTDCGEGTYAGWLRFAEIYCNQDEPTKPMSLPAYEPTMRSSLKQMLEAKS